MPFEARDLPTVVWIRDEAIVGPFCIHCGWPFSLHSHEMLCPKEPNPILGPCCDCHEIRDVEVTRMLPDPAYVGRIRRRRVTVRVKRIVRVGSIA
jgi:hypothetical protein